MDNLTASIVIPARNSPVLEITLSALAQQTALSRVKEVLVVGQQVFQVPSGLPVRYLPLENRPTPARNRNAGASAACGDWLLFTDADCQPAPDWVEQILKAASRLEANGSGGFAVAGAVDIPARMSYWGRCDHFLGFEHQAIGLAHPAEIPYAATLNFALPRGLFLELGGFDESFQTAAGEDREFCHRLTRRGHAIYLAPEAVVVHHHSRGGLASAWAHTYRYGYMAAVFRARHPGSKSRFWYTARYLARLPLIGELGGLGRVFLRGLLRPLKHPALLRKADCYPGMLILDAALTLGLLHGMRAT